MSYFQIVTPPIINEINESDYTSYYVDPVKGDDNNTGISEGAPVKTLDKVAGLTKGVKTKLLLKSGATFTGTLTLSNLQSDDKKPLIVDIYGGNERAIIDGNGADNAVAIRSGNVRFRNIKITNKSGKRGIFVTPETAGAFSNIEISGCLFEEINWAGYCELPDSPADIDVEAICPNSKYNYNYGGIIFEANTPDSIGASWFENIYITDNELRCVAKTGIWLNTSWCKRPGLPWGNNEYINDDNGWFPSKNVIVRNNFISHVGGDAIVLIATRNSFLDHNTVYHANYLGRQGYFCGGIWPHSSIDFTTQFNEVAYTHLEHGAGDGEGLDVDIGCINTVVQFNYVHHNDGGAILICNNRSDLGIGDHRGTVIRNNVFYANGQPERGVFTISSSVGKTDIYNNTIIVTPQSSALLVLSADWAKTGNSSEFTFRNNIFAATSPILSIFTLSFIDECHFENNLFWQVDSQPANDKHPHLFDPKITIPLIFDGYIQGLKFNALEPKVFSEGILFDGMSESDFAGNPAKGIKYIGAFANK